MYVQIIIFLYMIISLKSRIYLMGWNERIGGRRVGADRDLSRVVFPYVVPIDFRAFSLSFRPSRPPSYPRRRRDAEAERQISRTFPKCASIFPHISGPLPTARIILPLSSFYGPAYYEISSKTRYKSVFLFLYFFSPFFSPLLL